MGVAVLACSLAIPLQAETVTVSMKDRVFTPQQVVVKVGDTVRWINDDTELHQVISGRTITDKDLGRPMNSGAMLWNAAYAYTFAKPGAYPSSASFIAP
jgi:plastocyanin